MGFYGQVVYEFKKLFSSLKIIKNNSSEVAIEPSADPNFRVQALQPWDELNLAPANRWIQLNGNEGTKTVTIGHSTPGEKDDTKTVVGLSRILASEIPEGEEVTALDYGDYIQTTTSEYDAAGHSIGATSSYFKMPLGETVDNVNQLQADMEYVFTNFVNTIDDSGDPENPAQKGQYIETYLTNHGYVNTDTLDEAMANYLTENNYVTSEIIGLPDVMYPDRAGYVSIVDTIGTVTGDDGFSKSIAEMNSLPDANAAEYTVSGALQSLTENVLDNRTRLKGTDSRLNALIAKLNALGVDVGDI